MPTEDIEPEPWERQKGEQSKTFFYFTVYRDLGAYRTLENVIPEVEQLIIKCHNDPEACPYKVPPVPTLGALLKSSSRWKWVERCAAWDNHLDEVGRTEQELKVKEMVKRHADDSEDFQVKAKELLEELESVQKPTSKVWLLNSVVNTYNAAATLERASRGEPEQEEKEKRSGLKELGEIFDSSFPEDDEEEGSDEEEAEEARIPVETCPEEGEEVYSEEYGPD
jgi:hypothetical protein